MSWNTLPWWIGVLGGSVATAILGTIGFFVKKLIDVRRGKRDTIKSLQKKLDYYESIDNVRRTLISHDGAYYTRIENGKEMYYCSACFDDKCKLIKMTKYDKWYLRCPICKSPSHIDGMPAVNDDNSGITGFINWGN